MNTLIVYGTKYGCTEKCAKLLSQKLDGQAEVQNLKSLKDMDLTQYDSIIIGGSIYAGQIQKEVKEFCTRNMETLRKKRIGLFICGMQKDASDAELKASFPAELLENSAAKEFFGGEFIFKKMNFMEKIIVKMIAKTDKDVSSLSESTIDSFAKQMSAVS